MKVNDTCTGCEACLPYCPQGAIHMTEEAQAAVDRELCVECGVCIDPDICPVAAFEEDQDETAKFKRSFGRLLSKHLDRRDVVKDSPYDVKTNDVTAKIPKNKVVMRLELNRPGGGLTFRDVQQMGAEMQQQGWNPDISSRTLNIDEDRSMGHLLDQRILTCHFEVELDPEQVPDIVRDATRIVTEHHLWVSINVAGLAETIDRTQNVLKAGGVTMEPVAKVNLGLGRRLS